MKTHVVIYSFETHGEPKDYVSYEDFKRVQKELDEYKTRYENLVKGVGYWEIVPKPRNFPIDCNPNEY